MGEGSNKASLINVEMKVLFTCIFLLFVQLTVAQDYDALFRKGVDAVNRKKFCEAFDIFKVALIDSVVVGPYDYYSGAVSATNCNDDEQALIWLSRGQRKGLGLDEGDIAFLEKDTSLIRLHSYKEWSTLISEMNKAYVASQEEIIKREKQWLKLIAKNRIKPERDGRFRKSKRGTYALYFTEVDSLQVPYLVYIPTTYNESTPTQAIVYLHGGVVSQDHFQHTEPELVDEPIFATGEASGSIVIYPFGKRSFGWAKQVKAFQNIYTVLDSVKKRYNLDVDKLYLGGMSNGGTATFWFASHRNNIFTGFFAISANPQLEIGGINFENMSQGKPFYSLHAKNDKVFRYDNVLEIYHNNKSMATDWHFETIDSGGHGFIYDPDKGVQILSALLEEMIEK